MKTNREELDVEFIGDGKPLTKEEAKAISEYIRAYKIRNLRRTARKRKTTGQKRAA